jgi:hypothetical protein
MMPSKPDMNFNPTPYPDVNTVLALLLDGVRSALGELFVGLIVHGSLATGHYDPERSDIDFLAVTTREVPAEVLPGLRAMHAALTASGLPRALNMEGSYISRAALRRYDPAGCVHPALRVDGSFALDGHGPDWIIQRWIIRETGLVLAGPAPQTLIDPVSPAELRQAARGILREWWQPQLADPFRLRDREYQAYAALTMCRSLYTLQMGAVAPKRAAAQWAQAQLGGRWSGLIERALAWRHADGIDDLAETLELMAYTLQQSRDGEEK